MFIRGRVFEEFFWSEEVVLIESGGCESFLFVEV